MEQKRTKTSAREIGRRLYKALCALFPDRYVALIESREAAETNLAPLQPEQVNDASHGVG